MPNKKVLAKKPAATSGDVVAWGERWLVDWIAEARDEHDREIRQRAASNWRQCRLENVFHWWQEGQQLDRISLEHDFSNYAGHYNMTGNGMAIWLAFITYREAAAPIPEQILAMLEVWANRLAKAHGAKEVAEAIDMSSGEPGAQGVKAFRATEARRRIAGEIRLLIQMDRLSKEEIYERVAKSHRRTPGAVKRLWMDWQKDVREAEAALPAGLRLDQLLHGKVRRPKE